ncbi:MAG: hypothetical protein ACYTXY_23930 [Nostoc sp.]
MPQTPIYASTSKWGDSPEPESPVVISCQASLAKTQDLIVKSRVQMAGEHNKIFVQERSH